MLNKYNITNNKIRRDVDDTNDVYTIGNSY